jgi:hypothetical protein
VHSSLSPRERAGGEGRCTPCAHTVAPKGPRGSGTKLLTLTLSQRERELGKPAVRLSAYHSRVYIRRCERVAQASAGELRPSEGGPGLYRPREGMQIGVHKAILVKTEMRCLRPVPPFVGQYTVQDRADTPSVIQEGSLALLC